MSTRITECRGIGEADVKDCVETGSATEVMERCTVETDVCSFTTGDAGVNAKKAKKDAKGADEEECCCCEC